MKKLILACLMFITPFVYSETLNPYNEYSEIQMLNAEHPFPIQPILQPQTTVAFQIYGLGVPISVPVVQFYIVGGSATTGATYQIFVSSIRFTTTGNSGLTDGTTYWEFGANGNADTITKGVNYFSKLSTWTAGVRGVKGMVISTIAATNAAYFGLNPGVITSTMAGSTGVNCWKAESMKVLVASPTYRNMTFTIGDISGIVIKSSGLLEGTTNFKTSGYNTIEALVNAINNLSPFAKGSSGGVKAIIPQGSYGGDSPTYLQIMTTTPTINGIANILTVSKSSTTGISYTLYNSSLTSTQQFRLTDISLFTNIAPGTTAYLQIHNGTSTVNSMIRKEKVPGGLGGFDKEDYVAHIPVNGSFMGSVNTGMMINLINSAGINNLSYMNITGFRK